jgi:eukaryotic-like serine/threonine-protein kinase
MENPSFSAARADRDALIGELIDGRYRIERVLGTGGTGTVYQAEHVMMEKRVALKVLHETHAVVSSAMDRFQREAIALARIEHPNVVSATDFGKLRNGAYYLALEYVEGVSLGEVLATEAPFERSRALSVAYQIVSALGAAHSQGIVHRDLKSHNVMLTRAGAAEVVKVLDFGLAKLRSKLTQGSISMSLGQVFGTPHYMAPEQITGEGVDHRVDLYALGVIFYEMLAGVRPFEGKEIRDILAQQATQEPPPLPETVPTSVRSLVMRLLAKNKENRPASATEVMAELEPLLRGTGLSFAPLLRRLSDAPGVRRVVDAEVLRKQVGLGPVKLPVWALALPAVAFLAIFVVGLAFSGEDTKERVGVVLDNEPPAEAETAIESGPVQRAIRATPELIAGAEFGEQPAMEELSKIPPESRDRTIWVVLAKGYFAQKKPELAIRLLRQAVEVNSAFASDEEVSRLVRVGASDPASSKLAVATAAEVLGSRGMDILFSVWADTKHRTQTTALAEQYLQSEEIVGRASPALKLALGLRDQTDCEKVRAMLVEVEKIGDSRALRPLAALRKKRGCGAGKRSDCFPCLRTDDLLENAIAKAADRPGPKY